MLVHRVELVETSTKYVQDEAPDLVFSRRGPAHLSG